MSHRRRIVAMSILAFVFPVLVAMDRARAADKDDAPLSPKDKVIKLFNGKDLSGFYTWLSDTKHEDPRKVFTVQDGMIRISGDGYGYLATKHNYHDYHLVTEWKWGDITWEPRKERTKDSGILIHGVGPDGGSGSHWMVSIESQVIEGGCGDFILIGGKYADGSTVPISLTCEVGEDRDGETVWKKGGQRVTFNMKNRRRINWFGRDPDWQDVLGFRGKNDVEKPDGQWNRQEVICEGGRVTQIVNGVVVNEGFDAFPSSGKILLQTEKAEIFFRKFELWPLGKAPK